MLIDWDSVADTSIPTSGYLLYVDDGNTGNFSLVFDGTNRPGVTQYLHSPTVPGKYYRGYVVAVNFNGQSDPSDEAEFISCLPPTGLSPPTFVSSTTTSLDIMWNPPESLNGCPLNEYLLYIDDGAGGTITTLVNTYAPGTQEATITGLTNTNTYRFQLVADNYASQVWSGIAEFVMAAVPSQPAIPTEDTSLTTGSQIVVNYGTTLPSNNGAPIVSLELQMDDGYGGDFVTVTGNPIDNIDTNRVITPVTKGLTYRFRYRAKNANGWSDFSDIAHIKAAVQPGQSPAPVLDSATATTLDLSFSPPSDNGGSPIISYSLYINDGDDSNEPTTLVASYTSNAMTHSMTAGTVADDLPTSGLIYKFNFKATNAEGESSDSVIARYSPCDTPSAPANLQAMLDYTSTSQLGVQWDLVATT